jgi:predicted DNA-binding protein
MKRAVVRMPPEMVERLDTLRARLRAAHSGPRQTGRTCSRANVVRAIIASLLDAVEGPAFDKLAAACSRHVDDEGAR